MTAIYQVTGIYGPQILGWTDLRHFVLSQAEDTSNLTGITLLAGATSADYSLESDTSFTITRGGFTFEFDGSGLTYTGGGLPDGGVVDALTVMTGSTKLYGGGITPRTVAQFNAVIATGDAHAIGASFFAGDSEIRLASFSSPSVRVFGFAGDDLLSGGPGADYINGGVGKDTLSGGDGKDHLFGGPGIDILEGGRGNDYLNGGPGSDWASYTGSFATVVVTLNGNQPGVAHIGNTETDTLVSIENVVGGLVGDILTGDAHNNWLYGLSGIDNLSGKGGNDVLDGGWDSDILTGGPGADSFIFDTGFVKQENNTDVVTDFQAGIDRIGLGHQEFAPLVHGHLAAANFLAGPHRTHGVNHDYIVYDTKTGNLYWDESGNGTSPVFELAHFNNHPTLHATDFFIL